MHSTFYDIYLNSPCWRAKRRQVLARAHRRCERCNDLTPTLSVHHLHYNTLGSERLP